jgi:hypothetical protein
MKAELQKMLAGFSVGDYVTATGSDTRGHEVTRTGYLLAEPKLVDAERNGFPAKGFRLFIGAKGTDPSERTTWTTLFPGSGTVEHTPDLEAGQWSMTELRFVPGVKASSHTTRILYGGKGHVHRRRPLRPVGPGLRHHPRDHQALDQDLVGAPSQGSRTGRHRPC